MWGIQATKKDLFAIEDVTSNLAFFKDFFKAKSGSLRPTAKVAIEGLVRTHGLNYDEDADVMVLTDIGSAGSATDGAIIIIEDFSKKFTTAGDGGKIYLEDQIVIAGPMSSLGNPVDVAVNVEQGSIFVAERASEGGKFLVFAMPASSGDYAPVYSEKFPGASAVAIDFD